MALAVPQQWTTTATRDDSRLNIVPTAGNWVIVTLSYRVVDGSAPLATVADLARNYWLLCGTSANAAGTWRVEVWACPLVAYSPYALDVIYTAVSHIHATDVGTVTVHVAEVSGFVNGFPFVESVTVKTASAATTFSIVMPAPAGSVNCFCIASAAIDNAAATEAVTSAGWTALTQVSATVPDVKMAAAWRTSTATQTPAWSSSVAANWNGIVVALRETGTPWTQSNASWPAVRFLTGENQGLETPLPRVTWTDRTDRLEAVRTRRGIPYDLARAQAGEATATIQNSDGALTPSDGGAYDIYTPYALLMAYGGKIYPASLGLLEHYPQRWAHEKLAYIDAAGVDVLATLVRDTLSPLRGETLRHRPYAYWPCGDPAGSLSAVNIAGRSTAQLVGTVSKFGAAAATADFGSATSATAGTTSIFGDTGTGWAQTGLVGADTTKGYCLVATDDNFPPISGGVTIVGITRPDAVQPSTDVTIFILRNLDPGAGVSAGSVIKLSMQQTTNKAQITVWDKTTHAATLTTNVITLGGYTSWSVQFNRTAWRCTINGVAFTGSCNLVDNWDQIDVSGEADQFATGRMVNGTTNHVAVFDRYLTDGEVDQWQNPAFFAFGGYERSEQRIQRLLAINGSRVARALDRSDLTVAQDPGTGAVAQAAGDVADYETGLVFARADGSFAFRSKARAAQQSVAWVLGDNVGAGEIPYALGQVADYDLTYLYNEVQVNNAWESGATTSDPKAYAAVNAASVSRRGAKLLPRDVRMSNTADAQACADWLLAMFGTPKARIQQITVNAAANPTVGWPFVLSAETGDLVTIKIRPIGSPAQSIDCRIMQISADLGPRVGNYTFTLAAAPPVPVVLGDPVRGLLGGHVIGW